MPFLRQFQHLLPDAKAWRITIDKTLRRLFVGLTIAPSDARDYIDDVYADLFPDTTRELDEWERQFGLTPAALEADRRLNLAAEWSATGGQSPRYIQDVLQLAGFDVYVYDWWDPAFPGYSTVYDPRLNTTVPTIGTVQASALSSQPEASGEGILGRPLANDHLANNPNYLVNILLDRKPPPLITSDPDTWKKFIYISGPTFGDVVSIDESRRVEFERLCLKLCPSEFWIVTTVSYIIGSSFYFGPGSPGWDDGIWET